MFKVPLQKFMKWHELICCAFELMKRNLTVHDKEFCFCRNTFPNWRKFNIIQINGEHPNERILTKIHICWKTIDNLFSNDHFQDDLEIFWSNSNIHSRILQTFQEILRIWNLHLHCWFEIFNRHKNQHEFQVKAFHEHQSRLTKQPWRQTFKCFWTNSLFLHYNKKRSWQSFNWIITPQPSNVWLIQPTQAETKNQHIPQHDQASNDTFHPNEQTTKMFDLIGSDKFEISNVTHRSTWKKVTLFRSIRLIMKSKRLHMSNELQLTACVSF